MKQISRQILIVCSIFLCCLGIGVIGVAENNWFGSGDLWPYGIYSLLFAVILWGCASLMHRALQKFSTWVGVSISFFIGGLLGLVATFMIAVFLGPWFGAMSVPILKSWCVSGAITISTIFIFYQNGFRRSSAFGSLAIFLVGITFFLGFSPAWSLITGNQHLTFTYFRHIPGNTELAIDDSFAHIPEHDVVLLKSTGLKGRLEFRGRSESNSTDWPQAKAYVIFTDTLQETLFLPQPKHTVIVYVQNGSTFSRFPSHANTLQRTIEFYKNNDGWHYWIEHSSGAKNGGTLNL